MLGLPFMSMVLLAIEITFTISVEPVPEPNRLFDSLTSMLYHVGNTKSCGFNLQKYKDIHFHEYFIEKYARQTGKSIKFVNTLNSMLNLQQQHGSYLTKSDFLGSIQDLMLSKFNLNINNDISQMNDEFLIGYGVWIKETTASMDYTCIFVTNGHLTNDCFRTGLVDNESTNNNDEEFVLVDVESFNCDQHWLTNMENSFDLLIKQDSLSALNHDELIRYLVSKKYFNFAQWCGPVYDCKNDSINNWIVSYALPLFDYKKEPRGAFLLRLNVTNLDINQCADRNNDSLFHNTHKCKDNSHCLFKPNNGFKSGNYMCVCRMGYGDDNNVYSAGYDGHMIEREYWNHKNQKSLIYNTSFNCIKCLFDDCCNLNNNNNGPAMLTNNTSKCMQRHNMLLRYSILAIQSVFILITIIFAILIFFSRSIKIIKNSMWILLEIILLGAILIYFTIFIDLLEPSIYSCMIMPWFRELGFICIYGTLNLKLYKVLTEFKSRKAHCTRFQDKDIIRVLFFLVLFLIAYLLVWSLVDLEYTNEGFDSIRKFFQNGYTYKMCKIKWWDYFIEIAEFGCVCTGLYFLYCTRTAPSDVDERKFIGIIFLSECVVSTTLYILKKQPFWNDMHPDLKFLFSFLRCQMTITLMIIVLFAYKVCQLFKNFPEEMNTRAMSVFDGLEANIDSLKAHFNFNSHLNSTDIDESNMNELNHEEIRTEFKRLYAQLHVQKLISVKADNPHLTYKQQQHANRKNRRLSRGLAKTKDYESPTTKTPEQESICSNDLPNNHVIYTDDSGSTSNYAYLNQTQSSNTVPSANKESLERGNLSSKIAETQLTNRVQFK